MLQGLGWGVVFTWLCLRYYFLPWFNDECDRNVSRCVPLSVLRDLCQVVEVVSCC